jgi:hypothetical protein
MEELMQHCRFASHTPDFKRSLLLCALAAACALPLLPVQAMAGEAPSRSVHVGQSRDAGIPYGLVSGNGNVIAADRTDNEHVRALARRIDGDFLWFRSGGREYIVQDAATLKRVRDAWAPVEAVGAEMGGQGAEMGRHGASMGSLGASMALAAVTMNKAKMEAIGKQMEEAGKPMEAAGKKMEVLGKKMEREKEGADRIVRGAIDEAMGRGLAKPAPRG